MGGGGATAKSALVESFVRYGLDHPRSTSRTGLQPNGCCKCLFEWVDEVVGQCCLGGRLIG